jgi:hypothetical protein
VSIRPSAEAFLLPSGSELEARLARAFAVDPTPSQLSLIDRRVAAAVAVPRPIRRGVAAPRHVRRIVFLAAALLVAGAAIPSLLSLYGGVGSGGYRVAWSRATQLGIVQVHDGFAVTLQAAYADAAQTMLAISIVDTGAGRSSQVALLGADLTDETGRVYHMTTGGSTPAGSSSSINTVWYDTPGDGTLTGFHHFYLTLPDIGVRDVSPSFSLLPDGAEVGDPWHPVAGPWSFEFDLAIGAGTRLAPDVGVTVKGITTRLNSMLVTPTTVRLGLSYQGLPAGGSTWAPIVTVTHNGEQLAVGSTSWSGDPTTLAGSETASGTWVISISEFTGAGQSSASSHPAGQLRVMGPWELRFVVP